jgi:N6-adenosine-specific RNA methylase IME4
METNEAKNRYSMIVADPPWSRNQKGARGAQMHYDLMSLDEILNLPVKDLAAENSVCWLWVTNSTIDDGYDVLRKWGFEPKAILTWFKFRPQLGLGVYLRNDTEHVLLGTRGKMPIHVKNQPSWFIAPTARHSEKPREFFAIAERCYPDGEKLELFARSRQPGWDVWGLEAPGGSDIIIPGYPVPVYSDKVRHNDKKGEA